MVSERVFDVTRFAGAMSDDPAEWNRLRLSVTARSLHAVIGRSDGRMYMREVPANDPFIAMNALRLYSLVPNERRREDQGYFPEATLFYCISIAEKGPMGWSDDNRGIIKFIDEVGWSAVNAGIYPKICQDELAELLVDVGMYLPVPAKTYYRAIRSGFITRTQYCQAVKKALPHLSD